MRFSDAGDYSQIISIYLEPSEFIVHVNVPRFLLAAKSLLASGFPRCSARVMALSSPLFQASLVFSQKLFLLLLLLFLLLSLEDMVR